MLPREMPFNNCCKKTLDMISGVRREEAEVREKTSNSETPHS
jgi:hypothetical protein